MDLLNEWTDWKKKIIMFGRMDSRLAMKALINEVDQLDLDQGMDSFNHYSFCILFTTHFQVLKWSIILVLLTYYASFFKDETDCCAMRLMQNFIFTRGIAKGFVFIKF